MLGRNKFVESTNYMNSGAIQPLELVAHDEESSENPFVRAVVFGTGEIRSLQHNTEVYGLVLAGYDGLHFGDDGSFTGMVASELPLDRDGVKRVESVINRAVEHVNPRYCAECVGRIAMDEAAEKLSAETKQELGVSFDARIGWFGGEMQY